MKFNKWSVALAAAGVVSLGSVAQAEEAQHQVLTALSSTTLSGYIDASANWRVGKNSGFIPGRTFDGADRQDGFNLHAIKLTLEKPLDEGDWSAGYKADLVFGQDAGYYDSLPFGGGAGGAAADDDFAVKQAYVNFRAPVGNGLDFKMGVFDTIIGYEVFESANNPNYSRSYGYAIEPTHHTGLLASYTISESLSVAAGIANTYTGAVNGRPARTGQMADQTEKTYMASMTVTLPDGAGPFAGSMLYAGIVDGLNSPDTGAVSASDITSWYVGYTMATPIEGLALGIAYDYRHNGPNATTPGSNWANALAGYLSYQATEKLKLNARGDWANGSDGTFYTVGNGEQNELFSLTLTADYSLWEGLVTRLEGRWDRALNGDGAFGTMVPGSVNGVFADDDNVFTLALNTVYKF